MCDFREIDFLKKIECKDIKKLKVPGVYFVAASGSFYIYFDGKKSYMLGDEIN